jgi:hypothetical protein
MDKIAGDCRTAHPFPLPAKAHSENQVSLTLNSHIVTTKIHLQLRSALIAPSLQDYKKRKENWDEHIFSMIDWQAHGSYLTSLPFPKRVNVIKMIHNWQYTKSRTMHFDEITNSSYPWDEEWTKLRCTTSVAPLSLHQTLKPIIQDYIPLSLPQPD